MSEEEERPGESSRQQRKPASRQVIIQQLGPYMGLGWALAVSVALGTVGGYYADRWLGTEPWLTLAGIFLGMAAGITNVLQTLLGSGSRKNPRDRT